MGSFRIFFLGLVRCLKGKSCAVEAFGEPGSSEAELGCGKVLSHESSDGTSPKYIARRI